MTNTRIRFQRLTNLSDHELEQCNWSSSILRLGELGMKNDKLTSRMNQLVYKGVRDTWQCDILIQRLNRISAANRNKRIRKIRRHRRKGEKIIKRAKVNYRCKE